MDVKDFRVAPIAFRTFDGTSIPFADKAFDHVVLCFTLHHSHDPMALIQECRRVARRSIIVFEDLPDSRFGKLKVSLHVTYTSIPLGDDPIGQVTRDGRARAGAT